MAAVSLFSNTNMAAVTSCENALYSAWGVLLPKWVDTQYRYYNAYRIISDKIIYHYMVKVKYVASLLEIVKNIYLRRHWVIPEKQELLQKKIIMRGKIFSKLNALSVFPWSLQEWPDYSKFMLAVHSVLSNLVPRRSRLGQSWTVPSQTSFGQRVKRQRLGTRLSDILLASTLIKFAPKWRILMTTVLV